MEVLNYLKQIYSGKKAIENHISLFSIVGIFVISFLKYTASFGGMLVYDDFFIAVPSTNKVLGVCLFICIMSLFYLIGYSFKFINQVFFSKETLLPDFTLAPFYMFVRYIPIIFYWSMQYFLICLLGWYILLFVKQISMGYIFAAIMLCIIPFYYMIVVAFSKRIKYESKYFSHLNILKLLNLTFGKVVLLILQIGIMTTIPSIILNKVLALDFPEKYLQLATTIKLGTFCLSSYIGLILFYVFTMGVVNLIKSKTADMV
ncbi:MAG: hypothetical protein E7Z87_05485 [Cyanobacteria bacterium SIG26]|nr:hypothetical protein [Cyanobacteria bacterium SIG26]